MRAHAGIGCETSCWRAAGRAAWARVGVRRDRDPPELSRVLDGLSPLLLWRTDQLRGADEAARSRNEVPLSQAEMSEGLLAIDRHLLELVDALAGYVVWLVAYIEPDADVEQLAQVRVELVHICAELLWVWAERVKVRPELMRARIDFVVVE